MAVEEVKRGRHPGEMSRIRSTCRLLSFSVRLILLDCLWNAKRALSIAWRPRRGSAGVRQYLVAPSMPCKSRTGRKVKAADSNPEFRNDDFFLDMFGDVAAGEVEDLEHTYGAITPKGVRALIERLDIDSSDVFTDLGSGVGNVVLQFYCQTPVKRARGIELLHGRHLEAVKHIEDFKSKYGTASDREMLLVNGDLRKVDYSDSTIVFTSSTLFGWGLLDDLRDKCESIPRLKYLITQEPVGKTQLRLLGGINEVSTSWTSGSSGSVYRVYTNRPDIELRTAGR